MKIYWGWRSIPELAGLQSRERRRVWRANVFQAYRTAQGLASLAIIGAGTAAGALLASVVFESVLAAVAAAVVLGAVSGFIGSQFLIRAVRASLLAQS